MPVSEHWPPFYHIFKSSAIKCHFHTCISQLFHLILAFTMLAVSLLAYILNAACLSLFFQFQHPCNCLHMMHAGLSSRKLVLICVNLSVVSCCVQDRFNADGLFCKPVSNVGREMGLYWYWAVWQRSVVGVAFSSNWHTANWCCSCCYTAVVSSAPNA